MEIVTLLLRREHRGTVTSDEPPDSNQIKTKERNLMKNKQILLILLCIGLFAFTLSANADGLQQSYPVPQLYPVGQVPPQTTYPYQQQDTYTYPVQPQNYVTPQPQYYYYPYQQYQPQYQQQYQQPQQYQPQQQYYYSPQYYFTQPMYDPATGLYFYPISEQPTPYSTRPSVPYGREGNVIIFKQPNPDGSIQLTWTISNTTREEWGRSNVDIKCVSGCHLLSDPTRMLWDIPHTVPRNEKLTFSVNIWQPMYGETMTFAMVAGSKTLYTFTVNPN